MKTSSSKFLRPADAVLRRSQVCRLLQGASAFGCRATIPGRYAARERSIWNGPPERLSDPFRLTKQKGERRATAVCEVWSHPFGWELRLEIGGRATDVVSG